MYGDFESAHKLHISHLQTIYGPYTGIQRGGTRSGYAPPPLITLKWSIYNLCKANVQLMNNLNVAIDGSYV